MFNKLFFPLLLLSFYSGILYAQEEKSDCVIKLEQAQSKYDQGRIQDVEPLIGKCLAEEGFNKTGKTQALKLLTLSYLFLEEPEKAGESMLKLLHTNHLFTVNSAIDPSEFINLYEKYRHAPLFSIGFLGGGVVSQPIITQLNSTHNLNNENRQVYTPLLGFRVGVNAEYKLKEKIYASVALNYSFIKFEKTHEATKAISNILTDEIGFEGIETQTSIELPLMAQYYIAQTNNLTTYVSLGLAPQIMLNANYPGETISYTVEGSASVTSQNIILTKDRNSFNLYAIAAGGLKLKVGEGFVHFQLRYSYGILQSAKEPSALVPSNPNLLWDFNESVDGFRLHNLSLSVGYTFDIYVPKKLR